MAPDSVAILVQIHPHSGKLRSNPDFRPVATFSVPFIKAHPLLLPPDGRVSSAGMEFVLCEI